MPEPPIPKASDISALLGELRTLEPLRRERAASELFRAGRELASAATTRWFADPLLSVCFALATDTGMPEITVGIAVEPRAFEEIHAACGAPPLAHVPPDQDAKEFTLSFTGDVRLDILTTRAAGAGGAIDRFLARSGEGIQQVELLTLDLGRATENLRERFALEPIYATARAGADATRVNFFLVPASATRKILIELVESPSAHC